MRPATLLVLALAACKAGLAGVGPVGLVVEYFPPLAYLGEQIPICLRVSNRGDSAFTCRLELVPASADGALPAQVRELELEPRGAARVSFELPSSGWDSARVSVRAIGAPEGQPAGLEFRRLDGEGVLPALEAFGAWLRQKGAPAEQLAVVVLPRRTGQPDREWFLWKRLAERLEEGSLPAGMLVLAPAFGDPTGPTYFQRIREKARTWTEVIPLPGGSARAALYPALADLVVALEALGAVRRRPELLVWVVGCEDARRATPVRTFRKAVELILQRARAAGIARIVLLFLPEPAVEDSRSGIYAEELADLANAYKAVFARLDGLNRPEYWSIEESPGALGRYPNSRGQLALAEAVLARIRP